MMEPQSNILIYQSEDGQTKIQTRLEDETVWLTQEQMAELFQRDRTVVSKHIKNIFQEGELDENRVCAKFAHTTKHGAIQNKTQTSNINFYNLDVIISVGYRVKSLQGTKFRQWATARLRECLSYKEQTKNELSQVEEDFIEHLDARAKMLKGKR